jgi:hypothetical protein
MSLVLKPTLTDYMPSLPGESRAACREENTDAPRLGPEFFPVDMEELERLKGLNAKTCKVRGPSSIGC